MGAYISHQPPGWGNINALGWGIDALKSYCVLFNLVCTIFQHSFCTDVLYTVNSVYCSVEAFLIEKCFQKSAVCILEVSRHTYLVLNHWRTYIHFQNILIHLESSWRLQNVPYISSKSLNKPHSGGIWIS